MLKTFARIPALLALVIIIAAVALHGGQATAAPILFQVTKTADTADGTCDSDCSVREAFIAANAVGALSTTGVAGPPNVQIPAGTYALAIPGADENASATGDFDVTSPITVIGAGPAMTILDGANLDRLIDVRDTGSLDISGLTIQHGKVGPGAVAGLRADGPLVMTNVHVVNNEGDGTDADGVTGGVTVFHQALITDSVISNNTATGNSTGGLVVRDTANATIRNTTIEGNATTGDFPTGGVLLRGHATLDNVIVRNNSASGHDAVAGLFAGGEAVVKIMNSQFLSNDATGENAVGGIDNFGDMTIWDTTVDSNDATGEGGVGGILSLPPDDGPGNLVLRRVNITNNTAGDSGAGGLWIETPAFLGEVTIDHNSATHNATGGIEFYDANPVHLSRVAITNNSAGTSASGAMFVNGGSHITIDDSWIDHNTAVQSAVAGIDVIGNSVADLNRVGITNNSVAGDSSTGGISVYQATANLTNVTISGNSVVGNATGGAYVEAGTLNIYYTTIDNNTAGNSFGVGGLTSYGTLHVFDSILGSNPAEVNCYYDTATTSGGHNIDIGSDCGFNQGTDMSNTDPMLSSLADNGGFSPTEAIAANSPAVDAAGACTLNSDQRVFPRPQGNGCDIGAFESGSIATTDRLWGDTGCTAGVGVEDAWVGLITFAGVDATQPGPVAASCPTLGQNVYVGEWFLGHLWGDWDCDGAVNMFDVLQILRAVAELPLTPTNPCPEMGEAVPIS